MVLDLQTNQHSSNEEPLIKASFLLNNLTSCGLYSTGLALLSCKNLAQEACMQGDFVSILDSIALIYINCGKQALGLSFLAEFESSLCRSGYLEEYKRAVIEIVKHTVLYESQVTIQDTILNNNLSEQ